MKKIQMATATPWSMVPFTDCLAPLKVRKTHKILARAYAKTGRIPIVDQGQELIAGWTNDDSAAINEQLPLVVFGDHTRIFKYVNFPFALGADGTQLLKPRNDFNPYFFYFACLNVDLPSRGYNRHFSVLKEKQLPKPLKPEQQKIAAVLWKVQSAIETEGKLIATARELKQSAMRQLFTHGLRGASLKETEIGPLPHDWNVKRLETCCEVLSSSVSYTDFSGLPEAIGPDSVAAMGIKVSDMNSPGNELRMNHANVEKKVPRSLAERKLIPPDSVVFPKRGAAIATNKKRMTTIWTVLDPNLIAVRAGDGVNSDFLFYWFQSFDLRTITEPGPTPQLNKKNLTPLLLPIPLHDKEQNDIAHILESIDYKISVHERKRTALHELFQTLLHQLMTGEIRIADLDINVSEVTP